jgi:hypothetical protein
MTGGTHRPERLAFDTFRLARIKRADMSGHDITHIFVAIAVILDGSMLCSTSGTSPPITFLA